MIVLYIFIGILSLGITIILLILTIKFLLRGITYFELASIKLNHELRIKDSNVELIEQKKIKIAKQKEEIKN